MKFIGMRPWEIKMLSKTYLPKPSEILRKWHLIDAKNLVLGRLASDVANRLSGKKKIYYTDFLDCGDFVVVINAAKVVLTGKKLEQKLDFRHSGYPGGDKYTVYSKLMAENPEKALRLAVKGMLPKNKLGSRMITRLKIYKDDKHPHIGQINSGAKKSDPDQAPKN
jgi:large subunit ribosomal protein L13